MESPQINQLREVLRKWLADELPDVCFEARNDPKELFRVCALDDEVGDLVVSFAEEQLIVNFGNWHVCEFSLDQTDAGSEHLQSTVDGVCSFIADFMRGDSVVQVHRAKEAILSSVVYYSGGSGRKPPLSKDADEVLEIAWSGRQIRQ